MMQLHFVSEAQAEANAYWATREHKKWVVTLEKGPQSKPLREVLYVTARTHERAIACGIDNALRIQRPTRSHARLATAYDLGATKETTDTATTRRKFASFMDDFGNLVRVA